MKALQIIGYGDIKNNLKFFEKDIPKAGDNEVIIEIYAAGVNPIDYKIVEGAMKKVKKLEFPSPLGFDVAGVIVETGKHVSDFKVGDQIFSRVASDSPGTFAEFISIDSNLVCIKPQNLNFIEAASLPLVGITTIQSFKAINLKKGEKILIQAGSGGVGTFAIQYAKIVGAYVYTTTSTKNVSWVKDLGADRVIDYKKENYKEIAKGVDVVFDTLGGDYTAEAFDVIKQGGRVVSIVGEIDKKTAKDLDLNIIIRFILALKRRKITKKMKSKSADYRFILMHPNYKDLSLIRDYGETAQIKPVIDKVFPFSKAIEALEYQKTGHAAGKIILNMKQ